jgi:hypothetical protein
VRLVKQEANDEELFVHVLVAQPGFDSRFQDLDAFEEGVTDADLPNITRIRVDISDRQGLRAVEAQLEIDIFRRSGAYLGVTGSNPTWVRGASGEMRELLERGHRKWASVWTRWSGSAVSFSFSGSASPVPSLATMYANCH